MLLSLRKNRLTSLFKEVRVIKVSDLLNLQRARASGRVMYGLSDIMVSKPIASSASRKKQNSSKAFLHTYSKPYPKHTMPLEMIT